MIRSVTWVIAGILILLLVMALGLWLALTLPKNDPRILIEFYSVIMTSLLLVAIAVSVGMLHSLRRDKKAVAELVDALTSRKRIHQNNDWTNFASAVNMTIEELNRLEKSLIETELEKGRDERILAIGRLAAGIAHEIRNPITNVIGYAALLKEHVSDETILRDLSTIEEEARRCESITDSILAFSRTPKLKLEPITAEEIVPRIEGIEIEVEDDKTRFNADRALMSGVMENLVSNSKDAGAKRVKIVAGRKVSKIEFEVIDDGRGISSSIIERLFEPFATFKRGGLGLGLAISKGVVEAHGGSISASNRPEGGARFEILIPISGGKI